MSIGYEQTYQLRTGDFDQYRHPLPASILDIFQDSAGVNAESMPGMDIATMDERGLLWVVTRLKYELVGMPALHQQVRVRTWPLAPKRKGFQREYLMESLEGEVLAKGSSEWIVMSAATRGFVSMKDVASGEGDYRTDTVFEGRMRKIAPFEPQGEGHTLVPTFTDIDTNGHVNNTKYANYALDALQLGPSEVIRTCQIDYRRELRAGQHVTVHTRREGTRALVMGTQGGEVSFMMDIELA